MHTHAQDIVQGFVSKQLSAIHSARRRVWCAAVVAVMGGQWLSLSRLARGMMGTGRLKAALKRVDRLIGNTRIGDEAQLVSAALVRSVCQGTGPIVIAVDWSEVAPGGKFVELRAALVHAGMGRGLSIYHHVYPLSKLNSGECEHALLRMLRQWIAPEQQVIIVSDAGFRRPWFSHIEQLGWMWVGRIRSGVKLWHQQVPWQDARSWFAHASGKAKRYPDCLLTRGYRFACDVVLVRRHARARKSYRRAGRGSNTTARDEARLSAREPWLLAHCSKLRAHSPEQIVSWYSRRGQIEENFRDHKSPQFGMGLQVSQSRCAQRLLGLLAIGSLAAFVLWHLGQLAEAEGVHRRFKVTSRKTREISVITLALLMCTLPWLPLTDLATNALHKRLGLRQ